MSNAALATWLYEHTPNDDARFVLGPPPTGHPMVCVGVNPSTAVPGALDPTLTRVASFASRNGFAGWVMLNLYPQRSTDPTGMHAKHLPELQIQNEDHIRRLIAGRKLSLVAAWGGLIVSRGYLPAMLEGIVKITDESSCDWFSIGDLLKSGHPRHPSRASYAMRLQPFDVHHYLRSFP